jgi:carbon monoxide dehydrogenase subunit G
MKLEGEYTFDGPREQVWELVRDPDVLVTALPGAKSLEQVGENEYEGEMNLRVGPVAGVFAGRLVVSNEQPPQSCTLIVEGKGKQGFVDGTGHVNLEELEDNKTLMKYEGDVQVGGKLASVGQRLVDTASKSIIRQGLDTMNKALVARVEARETGEKVDFTPPSESEFAVSVAKDMAGEALSSTTLKWVVGAAIVIILILVLVLINQNGL